MVVPALIGASSVFWTRQAREETVPHELVEAARGTGARCCARPDPNDSPTVQVALSTLASGYYTDYSLVLSGASLAVRPVVAIFLLPARQIVGGIMQGAVKG
ncbi:hypothetical protein AB0425_04995 [Actinosynnema sp. NPDC051121]|nr:hypothetical protein [Saccharothrix sp.]